MLTRTQMQYCTWAVPYSYNSYVLYFNFVASSALLPKSPKQPRLDVGEAEILPQKGNVYLV